jgi:hypothetical protein
LCHQIYYVLFCRDPGKQVKVTIDVQHPDLIAVKPLNLNIKNGKKERIYVTGQSAGHSIVSANVTSTDIIE